MNLILTRNEEFVKRLTEITLENLGDENFGVKELAGKMGINYFILNRRLYSITKKSLGQFIREERLKKAMELLQQEMLTASEVAFKVGFNSPTYFNKCFHEYWGYPPGETKKKGLSETDEKGNLIPVKPEVEKEELTSAKMQRPEPKKRSRRIIGYFAIVLLLLTISISYYYFPFLKNSKNSGTLQLKAADKSVAVLPFKNLSDDEKCQGFASGVMDDILNHLFRIKGLKVISRTSVEQFREGTKSAPEIAKMLNVRFILEGSVQLSEGKVRVLVQLIDSHSDQHVWTKKFDSEFSNLFDIQSRIARQVADELQVVLTPEEITRINKIPTTNTDAHNSYILGCYYSKSPTEAGNRKSLEYFEKAVAADPNYAPAYIGLAAAYSNMTFFGRYPNPEGFAKAKELTLRALEIDKDLAEGHLMLGDLYCWKEWKWEEARKEYLLAIDLMPNCAAGYATYSNLLDILGQNDEARKYINIALELDPMSKYCIFLSSYFLFHEKKFKESLEGFQLLKELSPDDIYVFWNCFFISVWNGEYFKAVDELKKVMEMDTATIKYADRVKDIYNQSGMNGILNWLIDLELQKPNPSPIMLVNFYAPLGNKEEVLRLLEKAVDERCPWIPRLNNTPESEFVREEPRFQALIKKMGFTNYQPKKPSQINH